MLNRLERWFLYRVICLGLAWMLSPGVEWREMEVDDV